MPRPGISTAMLAGLNSNGVSLAFFVSATFASGPVYLWTGIGPITWNGKTWLGVGSLGGISGIEDGSTVEARGITLSLSGIDPVLLADVLGEFLLGTPAAVYLGAFNDGTLIASPVPAFVGEMDQPTIEVGGTTAVISINCESRLLQMNTAVDRRYTADDQQRDWPGDLGFSFVNAIQEANLYWGTAPTSSGNI